MGNNQVLVIGIGNEILTDDGIGPKLVKRLARDYPSPHLKYETLFVGGLEILEYIQGYRTVVFVDAIKTKYGSIGDVYYSTPQDFQETLHLSSLHDISFLSALELGKQINMQIPQQIHIIAIEIKEDTIFDNKFTTELQGRYDEIYEEVLQFIKQLD